MKPPEAAPEQARGPDHGLTGSVERALRALWYGRSPVAWLLLPFALVFGVLVALRRKAYRAGWRKVHRLPVPVIVVGNLTVGGTGKTPVAGWLVGLCRAEGLRPGIVSRGYGGRPAREARLVGPDDDAREVGDEPLLLRRQTGVPVCVHTDRVAACRRLLAEGVNVIVADDGLQHYRLHRDFEILVLDGQRRLGNGFLLPAGPLREPARRLREVDLVLVNGGPALAGEFRVEGQISGLRALDGGARCALESLRGQSVRVVAGIGNPARFHRQLEAAGLRVLPIPVADHGRVDLATLSAETDVPIIMTEKDAVKYQPVRGAPVWVAMLDVSVPAGAGARVLEGLRSLRTGTGE